MGQEGHPAVKPFPWLHPLKEVPGEHKGFGVGQHVVAQPMPFDLFTDPAGLHGQAVLPFRVESVARQAPFDPVDDPAHRGIGIPSRTGPGRVFHYPAVDQ